FKEVENNEDKCMNEICGKIKDLLDAAVQLINKSKYRLSGQNRNVRLFQHFVDEHQLWHAFIIYQDILGKRSEPICEVRFKSSFDAYQRILDRKLRKGNTAKKEVVSKGKRTIYYDDGSYNSVEENNK
ncbi:hypothetical protein KAR91_24035, partial [Candidatus Pacearchaeota archaeon]|nr:hypothetical protein [Candidatus Pacearchaeota archaeon]